MTDPNTRSCQRGCDDRLVLQVLGMTVNYQLAAKLERSVNPKLQPRIYQRRSLRSAPGLLGRNDRRGC
jgi:hypothetical protein